MILSDKDIDETFEKTFDAEAQLQDIFSTLGKYFVLALVENT